MPENNKMSFRKRPLAQALEPRVLLDAAAAETLTTVAVDQAVPLPESADDLLVALNPDDRDTATAIHSDTNNDSDTKEWLFIDAGVDDFGSMLQGLDLEKYQVVILDDQQDGFTQIASALEGESGVRAIHLVSHGNDGVLALGGSRYSSDSLSGSSGALRDIGAALASDADILLYGCDLAETERGEAFVNQLADMTDADVAASNDTTGLSGDWDLEYQAGTIETIVAPTLLQYQGDLEVDGVHAGTEVGSGTDELGWAMDSDGNFVVAGGWNAGAVQVWYMNGATRTDPVIITPDDVSVGANTGAQGSAFTDSFGRGVAISGYTLVIADPDAGSAGKLHIFQLSAGGTWEFANTINISDTGAGRIGPWSADRGHQYLAIDGGHILVGAPNEGGGSGRVFWYADTSISGNWSTMNGGFFDESQIGGSGNDGNDPHFGSSVAIAKDYAVISSASYDSTNNVLAGTNRNHGRVFVLDWAETSQSAPSSSGYTTLVGNADVDGINGGSSANDAYFGSAVDIEYYGGKYTIIAGAPGEGPSGEVYLYQTLDASMSTLQRPANLWPTMGGNLGSAVALSEGRALVGAWDSSNGGVTSAIFWEAPGNNWGVISGVDTSDPTSQGILQVTFTESSISHAGTDRMGWSVAFAGGNAAVIGSPWHGGDGSSGGPGAVDFFYIRTPVAADDGLSVSEDATNQELLFTDTASHDSNDLYGTTDPADVTIAFPDDLPDGMTWDGSALRFTPGSTYQYLSVGESATVSVNYTLTQGGFSSSATETITITGANDAPVVVGSGMIDLAGNRSLDGNPGTGSYQISSGTYFDVDGSDDLYYYLDPATTDNAIEGMISIDENTGLISWALGAAIPLGDYTVGIRVQDRSGFGNSGALSVSDSFTFTVLRDNNTPAFSGVPANLTRTEDVGFTYDFSQHVSDADDTGGDESRTYSLSLSGPGASSNWLTINPFTGVLSGLPSNANVGDTTVTITVTDAYGAAASTSFDVVVENVNDAPIQRFDIDRQIAGQGEAWSFVVPGTETPGDTSDDIFYDIDNPANTITYTAFLIDSSGNVLRQLGTSAATGGADGDWMTFNGTTFGGTPDDPLATSLIVRLVATDNGSDPAPAFSSTEFEVQVFAPTGEGGEIRNGPASSTYGVSTAISEDGQWKVVGGSTQGDVGRVWLYQWNGSGWSHVTSFTGSDVAIGDNFGSSVAIDADGTNIVVGSPNDDSGQGSIYMFSRAGSTVTQVSKAVEIAADRAAGDNFGLSVAIHSSGNTVLVGSPFDGETGMAAGRAYVLGWGATDTSNAESLDPQADSGESWVYYDQMGFSVAFDGNIAVVGAPGDSHDGAFLAGSAYLYQINNADNASTFAAGGSVKINLGTDSNDYDQFGYSVAIDMFDGLGGAASTLDSALIAIGTPGDEVDADLEDQGAVHLYRADGLVGNFDLSKFAQESAHSVLTAYDAQDSQFYGSAVALDVAGDVEGDVASSPSQGIRMIVAGGVTGDNAGSAYLYRNYSVDGWIGQRFVPDSASSQVGQKFGHSVAVAGREWVVGSPGYNGADGRIYTGTYNETVVDTGAAGVSSTGGQKVWGSVDPYTGDDIDQPGGVVTDAAINEDALQQINFVEVSPLVMQPFDLRQLLHATDEFQWLQTDQLDVNANMPAEDGAEALLFDQRTSALEQLSFDTPASSDSSCGDAQSCDDPQPEVEAGSAEEETSGAKSFADQLSVTEQERQREHQRLLAALGDLVA